MFLSLLEQFSISRPLERDIVTLILFNKPFGVVCQFSGDGSRPTLADFIKVPEVYPAGRLDTDSEGLLLLTDDGALQARISHPRAKLPKHYWVQVEGVPGDAALRALAAGVDLGDFVTRPGSAARIPEPPDLWPRNPPIRYRAAIPASWIDLAITEGKNRQVRRMTAKVGYPTLRLIRHRIGPLCIVGLAPGQWRRAEPGEWPQETGGQAAAGQAAPGKATPGKATSGKAASGKADSPGPDRGPAPARARRQAPARRARKP